ncbi:hypothetical protein [Streptomyces sp. NPDC016845]|uniref:hypothetical protein n=1 Tax=Streptomyces sp. NPDC016845 TaxID=3364972 RepID=UPI00379BA85C
MTRVLRRAVTGGLALFAALGMSVTSASAAGSGVWTVSPGGAYTGDAAKPAFKTGAFVLTCGAGHISGSFAASDPDGLAAGTLVPSYSTCSVAGIPFGLTASSAPWKINLLRRNAAGPSVIDVSISGIEFNWSATGCNAKFTGTVYGQYDNATGRLSTGLDGAPPSRLVAGPGAVCLGLFTAGDTLDIKAAYTLTPKQLITPPA